MDPNETLRLLRLTIKQMRVDEDPGVRQAHADEIAEYFEALDEWLSRGGFPPEAWREGPDAFGMTDDQDAGEAPARVDDIVPELPVGSNTCPGLNADGSVCGEELRAWEEVAANRDVIQWDGEVLLIDGEVSYGDGTDDVIACRSYSHTWAFPADVDYT